MDACSFSAEQAFGPAVRDCRRSFDFTLAFEVLFFTLLPAAVLIAAAAVAAVWVWVSPGRRRRLRWPGGGGIIGSLLSWSVHGLFVGLNLAVLVLVALQPRDTSTPSAVPAAVLALAASLLLFPLSCLHRNARLLVGIYLVVTLLLRAATTRTYWLLGPSTTGYHAVAATSLATLLVQALLLVLHERPSAFTSKRREHGELVSSEQAAGFCGRSGLAWLIPLLWTGFRRPLTTTDLCPIDTTLTTARVASDFRPLTAGGPISDYGLLLTSVRCLGLYAFSPVLPRLCLTGFTFAQPFLATSLIAYLSNSTSPDSVGYGLVGASLLVYAGIAFATAWYWNLAYKCVAKIRGAHVDAISQKILKLPQEDGVESKAMTLMISDVQRIVGALSFGHEFWAAPLETGLATWLLWRQVGPSSLTVLAISLLCTFGASVLGKHVGTQQQIWLKATEKRISATKKMLGSLKSIKMAGIDGRVASYIENLRALEFAASKLYRTLLVGSVFVSYSTLTLAPVVVFGAYIGATRSGTGTFDASRLFGSLILISLLASPLVRLLQIIPQFGAAFGCMRRLAEFLNKDEISPPARMTPNGSDSVSKHSDHDYELPEKRSTFEKTTFVTDSTDQIVIRLCNADIAWGSTTLLEDINLEVPEGQHIAVRGSVGSGKTLLLRAILGEITPLKGTVARHAPRGTAYCGQTPWLENLTVHENVFRFCSDDALWSQKVIDACAIGPILESHTGGETIGSGGSRLSGGEKQRLALARAVAGRPSILLMDDALSALDRSTKQRIMEKLLGHDGILKGLRTTVIHVTQDSSAMARADKVLEISERGLTEVLSKPFKKTEEDPSDDISHYNAVDTAQEESAVEHKTPSPDKTDKVNDTTKVSDAKVYKIYFESVGILHMVVFGFCGVAFAFTFKFPNVWVTWWADSSSGSAGENLGYWLGLYALLSILPLPAVAIWLSHLMLKIVPTTGLGLHQKLLTSVLGATFTFISSIDSGNIINRFNQDIMFIDSRLPLSLLNTVSGLLVCVIQFVLVIVPAPYILATLPVLGLVLAILQKFYLRTSKQLRQLELQSKAGLHTKLSETYEGLATIRGYGWQHIMRTEFQEKLDRTQEPFYLLYMVQTWLQLVLNLIVAGLSVTVVGVAIAFRHSTSASGIGLTILNLVNLGETLTQFITSWTTLETSLGAIARIEAFDKATPQEADVKEPVHAPEQWPSSGELVFRDVCVTYSEHVDDTPIWAIQDLSLQVGAGERVAVCGHTGSGKSTLMLSILALVETTRGTITLDGLDISQIPRSTLRSRLLVIPQDPYIEGDTIRAAVDPGQCATDEAVMEVLQDCGLWTKIDALGGLSSSLGDLSLSVGETQLFILARTVVAAGGTQGGLLLLDEATSSIDSSTEQRIMACIRNRLPRKTVISILHRLEAALEFDRIIVLEHGKLACIGTPEEVIHGSELFASFRKAV